MFGTFNPIDLLLAALLALSVACVVVVVFWPTTSREKLASRIADTSKTFEQRLRDAQTEEDITLRPAPKRLFKRIFDGLRLEQQADDPAIIQKLRMAGFRGQGPIITFLAVRIVSPLVMFAAAFIYVALLLKWNQPLAVKLLASALAGGLGWFAPTIYLSNRISRRQSELKKAWPDTLDLLLICVESGMSLDAAFIKVAGEIGLQSQAMEEELRILTAELNFLPERRTAYQNLVDRTGLDGIKSAVTSLVQAERYGTAVGQSLRVLARESRDKRMMDAEAKAAALPPKLTVPMIIFFLPVLFAVIMTPAILQLVRQ